MSIFNSLPVFSSDASVLLSSPWTTAILCLLSSSTIAFCATCLVLIQFLRKMMYVMNQMTMICASVTRIITDLTSVIVDLRQSNIELSQALIRFVATDDLPTALARVNDAEEVTLLAQSLRHSQGDT